MTLQCSGASKAKVSYKNENGVDSVFETTNVPITVECEVIPRTGRYIYTVFFTGYFAGSCNAGNGEYGGEFTADSYTTGTDTPFPTYENCPAFKYEFFIDGTKTSQIKVTPDRSISQRNNPNYSEGGKYLTIKNAQGVQIFKKQVKDCNYKISCGDDCPDGQIKCTHNKYPGYCCIPCQSTASKINNLASKTRAK
ncbi:hypothetical protein [Anabaena sp. CCY 9402-a]|uniref:hypothetical protein n=1 Tax=Anabaena sp. CCY 9402-a TaxID=3103867 RepID=UPI0039C6B439